MRKSESAINRCKTISTVQKLLGGKYKIEILWYIGKCDVRRFGQLRRQIGEITESSLTKQLRELEADGFILRHDFCEVPPRVEYSLTELGESFLSVLDYMKDWGMGICLCKKRILKIQNFLFYQKQIEVLLTFKI